MKRLILALVVVAAVAAVGFGSAAAISIDGRDLGAGTASVANGATGTVSVSYETNVAGPSVSHPYGGFGVWGVYLTGLQPGEKVIVSLMGASVPPAVPAFLAIFAGTADGSGNADLTKHFDGTWKPDFACWADEVYRVDIVTKSAWAPGDGSPP
jgi:hypothetical protein